MTSQQEQSLTAALMDIVRMCEGQTSVGNNNWESRIGQRAKDALTEAGVDWKILLNIPPTR